MSFLRQAQRRTVGSARSVSTFTKLMTAGLLVLSGSAWAQTSTLFAWSPSPDGNVVGYKFYQGGVSGAYTNVVDVGNTTSNLVVGLSVGATYFFAVTAYNSFGLESPFSNEIAYSVPSSTVLPVSVITFAADSGTITAPFTASGGIVSQPVETGVTDGGRAAYTFSVANAGSYIVSALVNAPTEGVNSFYVNMDAEPADPTMIWDIRPLTTKLTPRTVTWRGNGTDTAAQYIPAVFNLSAGSHQLIVRGRELNTQLGAISIMPYLKITNCVNLGTGNRSVRGTGVANAKYVLFASSSLAAPVWTPISTNTSDAFGAFNCSDLTATNYSRRFYRIQAQ
jgi:hypothetical protein